MEYSLQTMLNTILVALLAVTAAGAQGGDRTDIAVRAVISRYVAARQAQDGNALAALFTEDVDQLVSSGEWRRGRAEVVRGTLASSQSAAGTRSITVESVRLLSADAAVADGRYEIAGMEGGTTRRMWTCIVLRRTAGEWRIAAIRNMLPAPATK
jgi:uncharacterized protein (TIGR02246 family)